MAQQGIAAGVDAATILAPLAQFNAKSKVPPVLRLLLSSFSFLRLYLLFLLLTSSG